ncbi:UNVERIFIED_CONTAM: protein STRUBBELIG-RECEPTOR FAMILY 1 [Sesamum angustifolium]|uniref:Protein STRUBBELIG-RECEPTOR FAMILY 1 n=1 Tax=Sesamum angustifolium TaxID=2727405 RepID=A0AAW2PEF7_9LAMI
MACSDWSHTGVLGVFLILAAVPLVWGFTDPRDVYAITQLHASLGFPLLPGWIPGGDPCGPPSWQGVECVNANITAIKLNGANLGGELSEDLGSFASIILIDLSNNHIGGSIPTDLPTTLRSLSLNNNQLTGPIPDAFEPLKDLINMDLSGNSLTSQLPSSMGNLSSLTTLHLQNNKLTGLLDVLQNSLVDLNIENNLFSGPIPDRLLSIPNFRRAGNPFNTTILPSPPASPPILPPSGAPSPQSVPGAQVYKPSAPLPESGRDEKKHSTNKITWIAVGGLLVVLVLLVVLCLSMSRCCRGRRLSEKTSKNHEMGTYGVLPETHRRDQTLRNPLYQVEKGPQAASKKMDLQPAIGGSRSNNAFQKQGKDHRIDMMGSRDTDLPPGHLPFPLLPAERIVADPTFTPLTARENASKIVESSKYFTIASLQQYTNSFSQENFIGRGTLGTVYRAQLPDGKVLAVKKLDKAASAHLSDREFLGLVSSISKLRHENIVELVGYCLEHGQRLLVYSYCRNGTLDEALNLDDEINKKLSWNVRMRLALQAAKTLEYLHEVCQPPVMHRNFKSCNVLLEDDLTVRVSDCGLASLLSTNSMAKLQESGYGAPELELGSYSCQSDVYSFGVVMLQLLTGRKSYDRFRPRGEQHLVRWALSRLHDIDTLSRMVDPSLNGAYPSKSLSRVADIISLCIQPEPEFRPPMSEIVQKLLHMIQRDS